MQTQNSWLLSQTEQKSCNYQSFSFLLYLHFICLAAARPSPVVLWGAGGVLSSLTHVGQIACRRTMGEHLDLGHALFVVAALLSPFYSFFHFSLLLCFSNSVKKKSSCLTSFQAGSSPSCLGHLQQDVGSVVIAVDNACLISRPLAVIKRFSYHKEVFLQEILCSLFVVSKHINFRQRKQ